MYMQVNLYQILINQNILSMKHLFVCCYTRAVRRRLTISFIIPYDDVEFNASREQLANKMYKIDKTKFLFLKMFIYIKSITKIITQVSLLKCNI